MKINIQELKFKITRRDDPDIPDVYAFLSITFIDEKGRYFTCSGFTLRQSKFNKDLFLAMPSKKSGKGFFIFNLIEKSLLREIEKEAIREYKDSAYY